MRNLITTLIFMFFFTLLHSSNTKLQTNYLKNNNSAKLYTQKKLISKVNKLEYELSKLKKEVNYMKKELKNLTRYIHIKDNVVEIEANDVFIKGIRTHIGKGFKSILFYGHSTFFRHVRKKLRNPKKLAEESF